MKWLFAFFLFFSYISLQAKEQSWQDLTKDHVRPRSVGGNEVALFHAAYVGTHTDRRLFIADAGNARIVSVKLDYHATETVGLKEEK